MNRANRKKKRWLLVPLFGSLLYGVLYSIATLLYPGGSQYDQQAKGFSWMHNYWCNLLNERAINGAVNPARPVALVAMGLLCATVMVFWFVFPMYAGFQRTVRLLVQASGITAMGIGLFLFTPLHDMVINAAGLFGLVAFTGTLAGLKKLQMTGLFRMGLFVILLIAVNNLLYYGPGHLYYLPLVQKITFFCFLLWICLISLSLHKGLGSPEKEEKTY